MTGPGRLRPAAGATASSAATSTVALAAVLLGALLVAACGARFHSVAMDEDGSTGLDTGTDTTTPDATTPDTTNPDPTNPDPTDSDKANGSFEYSPPQAVTVGDEFDVVVTNVVGGRVRIDSVTGTCHHEDMLVTTNAVGDCAITLRQRATATHNGSVRGYTVEVVDKNTAHFELVHPGQVDVGEEFVVALADGAIGVSRVTITAGAPCTELGAATGVAIPGDGITFRADTPGSCSVTATGRGAGGYHNPAKQAATVEVQRPQGIVEIDIPLSVEVGTVFVPVPVAVVGGDVEFELISGRCGTFVSGQSDDYMAREPGECVFRFTQNDHPDYRPADPETRTVTINPIQPAWTLGVPAHLQPRDQFEVLIVGADRDLIGHIAITPSGQCTVLDATTNRFRATDTGSCTITASNPQVGNYAAREQTGGPIPIRWPGRVVIHGPSTTYSSSVTIDVEYEGGKPTVSVTPAVRCTITAGVTQPGSDSYEVQFAELGPCTVSAAQAPTDTHTADADTHETVLVPLIR